MFARMMTVIKAKWNRLLGRMEDPAEILDYSYQRQLELLQKFRRGIADLVTAKKRIRLQRDAKAKEVAKLEEAARAALRHGDEQLARRALERKQFISDELAGLDQQVAELEGQQDQLVAQEQKVRAKVQHFRTQKEVAKAQYSAAKARVELSQSATGISGQMDGGAMALQRAMDRVEDMRARAGALEELERAGTLNALGNGETDLDREIRELTSVSGVEAEMEKLRLEMGIRAPAGELPAAPAMDEPAVAPAREREPVRRTAGK